MISELAISALAGAAVGAVYFALLWKSAQVLTASGGYRVFALAAIARMALVLGGIALLFAAGGGLWSIGGALFGFVAARMILTHRLPVSAPEKP